MVIGILQCPDRVLRVKTNPLPKNNLMKPDDVKLPAHEAGLPGHAVANRM
jgi:hypothetical protein